MCKWAPGSLSWVTAGAKHSPVPLKGPREGKPMGLEGPEGPGAARTFCGLSVRGSPARLSLELCHSRTDPGVRAGGGSWWDCTRSAAGSVSNRFALLNPGETAQTLWLVMLRVLTELLGLGRSWEWCWELQGAQPSSDPSPADL